MKQAAHVTSPIRRIQIWKLIFPCEIDNCFKLTNGPFDITRRAKHSVPDLMKISVFMTVNLMKDRQYIHVFIVLITMSRRCLASDLYRKWSPFRQDEVPAFRENLGNGAKNSFITPHGLLQIKGNGGVLPYLVDGWF